MSISRAAACAQIIGRLPWAAAVRDDVQFVRELPRLEPHSLYQRNSLGPGVVVHIPMVRPPRPVAALSSLLAIADRDEVIACAGQ